MTQDHSPLPRPRFTAQSVSQQLSDYLRAAIVQGTIKPGQRLIEETLAQELGVSRTPVREALRRLEAEGLIKFEAQKGARVRAVSAAELQELYELRVLLEGHAARRAAQNMTDAELDALRANANEFRAILNQSKTRGQQIQRLIELNNEFHTQIIHVSRNRHLIRIATALLESNALYGIYYYHDARKSRISLQEHQRILDALAQHDAARAEKLMQAHLKQAQQMILEAMQDIGDAEA